MKKMAALSAALLVGGCNVPAQPHDDQAAMRALAPAWAARTWPGAGSRLRVSSLSCVGAPPGAGSEYACTLRYRVLGAISELDLGDWIVPVDATCALTCKADWIGQPFPTT